MTGLHPVQLPTRTEFGALLRRYRERARLSQIECSVQAGIDKVCVHLYESNKRQQPSRDVVLRLARVLDLSMIERDLLLLAAGHCPDIVQVMGEPGLAALYALYAQLQSMASSWERAS